MAAGPGRQPFQGALWVSSGLGQLGKEWRGQRVQGPRGYCTLARWEDPVSFQSSSTSTVLPFREGRRQGWGRECEAGWRRMGADLNE